MLSHEQLVLFEQFADLLNDWAAASEGERLQIRDGLTNVIDALVALALSAERLN
jgi:hypothetical protein